MKKGIVMGLLVCLLLTGCRDQTPTNDATAGEGHSMPPQNETVTQPATDATDETDARLAYYEQLVNQLQQELLEIKTTLYVSRVEYETRIAELKSEIEKGSEEEAEKPEKTEGDFLYVIENGVATVIAYQGDAREVTVPATLGGFPVGGIGDRAFMDQPKLISVILPDTVTAIGWFAFSGCVSLESVRVPIAVERVSYGAFQNCPTKMKLICAEGSYAEQFARSYGMMVVHE